MGLLLAITIVAGLAIVVVIAALSRHKKASANDIKLLGEIARVDRKLDPEGTVLVSGELWRARSIKGAFISSHARVRVVGFQGHLVLVEVCD